MDAPARRRISYVRHAMLQRLETADRHAEPARLEVTCSDLDQGRHRADGFGAVGCDGALVCLLDQRCGASGLTEPVRRGHAHLGQCHVTRA
jgi:hypothetical protein